MPCSERAALVEAAGVALSVGGAEVAAGVREGSSEAEEHRVGEELAVELVECEGEVEKEEVGVSVGVTAALREAQGEALGVKGALVATALEDGVGEPEVQREAARLSVDDSVAAGEADALRERAPVRLTRGLGEADGEALGVTGAVVTTALCEGVKEAEGQWEAAGQVKT